MRGNRGQRSGAESVRSSHELSQAIRYLPPPLLPQPAWRCLGMGRVMGIELMDDSEKLNILEQLREASAIQVRNFAVRGAV